MKIENIKDLEAVLKLCRKQGLESIKIDGIEISFGDLPDSKPKLDSKTPENSEITYTDEQMLFWSSAVGEEHV